MRAGRWALAGRRHGAGLCTPGRMMAGTVLHGGL